MILNSRWSVNHKFRKSKAIRSKNKQLLKFLKENPDQINARNEAGQTALLAAVSDKKLETVKMFYDDALSSGLSL